MLFANTFSIKNVRFTITIPHFLIAVAKPQPNNAYNRDRRLRLRVNNQLFTSGQNEVNNVNNPQECKNKI